MATTNGIGVIATFLIVTVITIIAFSGLLFLYIKKGKSKLCLVALIIVGIFLFILLSIIVLAVIFGVILYLIKI